MTIRFIIILMMVFLTSCSNYINRWHQRFDNSQTEELTRGSDKFGQFRQGQKKTVNSSLQQSYAPKTQRQYQIKRAAQKKRVKASDLKDNTGNNSLWVNDDSKNMLFSDYSRKSIGDIVVINVQEGLKKDITRELKAAFPDPLASYKSGETKKGVTTKTPTKITSTSLPAQGELDSDSKIYDKISSVVVEEIDSSHLLLRGRKQLIYQGHKRSVEIQIMIPQREIINEVVNSDAIVEQSITVLR